MRQGSLPLAGPQPPARRRRREASRPSRPTANTEAAPGSGAADEAAVPISVMTVAQDELEEAYSWNSQKLLGLLGSTVVQE